MKEAVPANIYCSKVFDGTHDTPKPKPNGFPLVTSKNILGGRLNIESTYNISAEDYYAIQKRSAVSQWDVLFSMIGSIGEVYLEKNEDISYAIKNVGVFSCNDEYKAKWLYYYFLSPYAKKYIENYLTGAVQKFLGLEALRSFPIIKYDTNNKSSVDILSAIDSKIELNNKVNTELETMAKIIYEYWFVQYDFSNENGKPYKSSGGHMVWNKKLNREIPDKWTVDLLGNALKTVLGGTPSTYVEKYWKNGSINWLSSAETEAYPVINAIQKITQAGIDNSATVLLPKGSVVISIVRYIRPSILAIDACTNQSVVGILESDELKNYFIYPFLVNEVPRLMALRTGAQQPHINKASIDETLIIIPPNELLRTYYDTVKPIYDKITNTAFENDNLIKLRDWLLPMLMNDQATIQ